MKLFRKSIYITVHCIACQSYFTIEANSNSNDITSYFFSKEQEDAILDNLNKMKNNTKVKNKQNKNKIKYKVEGICYLSPNNWTVWINGKSYNKIGQYYDFSIDEVSQDNVTITTSDCKTIHLSVRCDENLPQQNDEINNENTSIDEISTNSTQNSNKEQTIAEQDKDELENKQNNIVSNTSNITETTK